MTALMNSVSVQLKPRRLKCTDKPSLQRAAWREIQGAALVSLSHVWVKHELNSCSAQLGIVGFFVSLWLRRECDVWYVMLSLSLLHEAISRGLYYAWHFGTRYRFYLPDLYWTECLPSCEFISVAVNVRCSAGTDVTDAAHPAPVTFSLIFANSSQKLPPPRKGENTNEWELECFPGC